MMLKYEKIKQDIVIAIESGQFKPGDKIYSEGDLKKLYHVSSTTVVKALNDLVSEGYLIRRQGEGTFVRKHLKRRSVFFSEEMGAQVKQQTQKIVEATRTFVSQDFQDEQIALALGDKKGKAWMVHIAQVALINGTPWKLQNRYLRAELLDEAARERLRHGASLSDELHLSSNLITLPFEMALTSAMQEDLADYHEIFEILDMPFETATNRMLFKIMKTTLDLAGKPIEYEVSYIHPDYYTIHIQSN